MSDPTIGTPPAAPPVPPSDGVTSMMIPVSSSVRAMATAVHRELRTRDPRVPASEFIFCGDLLTVVLGQLSAQLWPPSAPTIVSPDAPLPPAALQAAETIRRGNVVL